MRLIPAAAIAAALGATVVLTTVGPAHAAQNTDCQRAGMNALKSLGAFSTVAKSGLPIDLAVSLGVSPRAGTDVGALPDPLPLRVVLADHRAGTDSLFEYPWC